MLCQSWLITTEQWLIPISPLLSFVAGEGVDDDSSVEVVEEDRLTLWLNDEEDKIDIGPVRCAEDSGIAVKGESVYSKLLLGLAGLTVDAGCGVLGFLDMALLFSDIQYFSCGFYITFVENCNNF